MTVVGVRRIPLLVLAMLSLTWGIWLGLLRLGWALPLPWPDQLILHGPLMIGGFLGTVIGLERAIGLGKRWAYAAPICAAAGAVVLVLGPPGPMGPVLITVASSVLVMVFMIVLRQQATLFVATMLAGAAAWLVGNIWWLAGAAIYRVVSWWIGFVVLTIAGERLELNRVLRPTIVTRAAFFVAVSIIIIGITLASRWPATGARVLGVGLLTLTSWLLRYDIAKRTVRQAGVTRYMAVCLLAGYAWLAVAGVLLLGSGPLSPGTMYDAILHALFIGFVLSMVFGHAPIILPAVLGRQVRFTGWQYVPLMGLHASMTLRVVGDLAAEWGRLRSWGGIFNALAIGLFIVNTLGSIAAPPQRR